MASLSWCSNYREKARANRKVNCIALLLFCTVINYNEIQSGPRGKITACIQLEFCLFVE